jgi:gliding motility-associated-like protein
MLISGYGYSQIQVFPEMGQLPSAAFPLCCLDTFRQLILPYGSGGYLNIPGCGAVKVPNPFYYSFYCYTAGQLSILIDPLTTRQDYNWELYDITGHDPNEIYQNNSLAVIGNWSSTPGSTGARSSGHPGTVCTTSPIPNDSSFSEPATLIQGHHYLLLVCDYSQVQSDYLISFAGSTAVISNPAVAHIQSAYNACNKKMITVVTSKKMRCLSLATDGSNFILSPGNLSVTAVTGLHCNDQFDFDTLQLTLNDTLAPGNYFLTAKTGTDGNIPWDDCLHNIPAGDQVSFTVLPTETVSADFNYHIGYGCLEDTAFFEYPVTNISFQSFWFTDSLFRIDGFEPVITTSKFAPMLVQHIVSNGLCSDTVTKIVPFDNLLQAVMQAPERVCPNDIAAFTDQSIGNIIHWNWIFGDGTSSSQQQPPVHSFPASLRENSYQVKLIIENNLGCYDTASASVVRLQSCSIAVPNAFTPNKDGRNDYLYPLNTFSVKDLEFMVFNRLGQLVFETRDPAGKWDGSMNGKDQPDGPYVWTLRYTDGFSGRKFSLRGTSVLIR